jgi:tRNA threonylcarbamoyladenosine biosynthesis protein TsaB
VRLLAIDTATPASSVALADGREVVASASRVDPRGHSAFLVPAIDFCFDQVGWNPGDLDAVVVDIGPGLYTGIRVGLATAQALGAAVGIPIVPATALDALALRAATGRRHIWSVVDVRRGEIAASAYQPVPGGVVKDGPPRLLTPERLRGHLESDPEDVLVVGNVAALPEGTLRGLHRVKIGRPRYPSAEALVEIAIGVLDRGEPPHPEEIRPLYLREPDVTINWSVLREEGPWADGS